MLAVLAFSSASAQGTSLTARETYARHDSAAAAARKAGDWQAYQKRVASLDSILNGNPSVRIVSARIAARLGDTASAYSNLREFAATGLIRKIEADSDLVSLKGTASWNAIVSRISANAAPRGEISAEVKLEEPDFVAEDIAWDPASRRWFVSSVRHSVITTIDRSGKQSVFARSMEPGRGFFGVAVDPERRALWATLEANPVTIGYDSTLAGKASILKFDLATANLVERHDILEPGLHGAGDIALAGNGDVFISDGRTGALRVIRSGGKLETLVPPGELMSPQGSAVAGDGIHIYLADYRRGIARIDRNTGRVEWLSHSRSVALNGIDGLSVLDGRTLIGVQNGTNPHRLIRISLDASGTSVQGVDVIAQDEAAIHEPTHGILVEGDYYFIANGGWDAFGDDGRIRAGVRAQPPVVMRISGLR